MQGTRAGGDARQAPEGGQRETDLAHRWAGPLAAGALPLAVYLATSARHVLDGDAAVLAAQAYRLGLAHPPGYALMGLLGELVTTCVPFGPLAWRANLVAVAAAVVTLLLGYALLRRWSAPRPVAVTAVWFLAFSPLFWSQALHVNAYVVAAMVAFGVLLLLDVWSEQQRLALLVAAGVLFGLGLGGHPSLALYLPAVALFAVARLRREGWRRLLFSGAVGLLAVAAGCLVWLGYTLHYLLRVSDSFGAAAERLGGLLTASGTASDWRWFFTGVVSGDYPAQLARHVGRALVEFSPVGAALAVAGVVALARRRRDLLLLVGLGYLAQMNFAVTMRHWHFHDVYRLPCYALQALLMGVGLSLVWSGLRTVGARTAALAAAGVLVFCPPYGMLLLAPAGAGATGWLRHLSPKSPSRAEFARQGHLDGLAVLAQVPPGATVVANHGPYGTLFYLRSIEGAGAEVRLAAGFGRGGESLRSLLAARPNARLYAYLRRDEERQRQAIAEWFETREVFSGALHTLSEVVSSRGGNADD